MVAIRGSGTAGRLGLVVAMTSLFLVMFPSTGSAAPEDTAIRAYLLPCGKATCDDASKRVSDDSIVSDSVQLQASTSSTIGLRTVEIQFLDDGSWTCLKKWTTSARSGVWTVDVDTSVGFQGCNGESLTNGKNGSFRFRSLATDRAGDQASSAFSMRVSNRPGTPKWAGQPTRANDRESSPVVTLRWYRNSEPDIVEYHFVRSGPDGTSEYAVSAERPGGQGCSFDGTVYTCTDDDFSSKEYAGTYRYSLIAFRASPDSSSSCSLPGSGNCVDSTKSSSSSVKIQAPVPPPPAQVDPTQPSDTNSRPASTNPAPTRRGPPSLSDIAAGNFANDPGVFDERLPYEPGPGNFGYSPLPEPDPSVSEYALDPELAANLQEERLRRNLLAVAGGLVLLVLAIQLTRMLRGSAQGQG